MRNHKVRLKASPDLILPVENMGTGQKMTVAGKTFEPCVHIFFCNALKPLKTDKNMYCLDMWNLL